MVDNYNASKTAPSGEIIDIKKYIGVASVSVLAINPNNEKLRKYGWSIPQDADEPTYVTVNNEGKKSARVRFLVQIQDLDDKPIVAMDFWIRPDVVINKEKTKAQIIDSFGRTAWGTQAEVKAHKIPQYASGPAQISTDYKMCHVGEDALVAFLMKLLNITPMSIFNRAKNAFEPTKNPGHLTIDHWDKLCTGDITELAEYVALQPDNKVKVIFGIRTTDENKTYQTFLSTSFIGNGAFTDRNTGEYAAARKAIDRYFENRDSSNYSFSASPVKEWGVTATDVKDNSEVEDLPAFDSPEYTRTDVSDLPFADI